MIANFALDLRDGRGLLLVDVRDQVRISENEEVFCVSHILIPEVPFLVVRRGKRWYTRKKVGFEYPLVRVVVDLGE